MSRPTVLCLTPVKNEAWILDRFLAAASLWADRILVADQGSTDGSREIARCHPKVTLLDNPAGGYHEQDRQQMLVAAAREVPGPRFLVALDADEFLSANVLEADEWQEALSRPSGTVVEFGRVELYPDPDHYFRHSLDDAGFPFAFAYADDGAAHSGSTIHSPRVPLPPGAPRHRLKEVVVLHYQFCDLRRTASKHRWYRCFERLTYPAKGAVAIERTYDWFERDPRRVRPCPTSWLGGYLRAGLDMRAVPGEEVYWWDWDVLRMFAEHGAERFRDLDVWQADWEGLRQKGLAEGVAGLPRRAVVSPQRLRDRLRVWLLRASRRWRGRGRSDRLLAWFD
jgi:hypothetical protein